MSEEKIRLKYPVVIDGVERTELVLTRRVKPRDLERLDKVQGETARMIQLIADLAEWTPDQVRELDMADFMAVVARVNGFLS